jgi:prolyl-tRNA synthetase
MRWSQAFIPTLREAPADAETASHRLLLRGGYIRQVAPGVFAHLLLAQKSILRITHIIREEMDSIGGQEIGLPVLSPSAPAKGTGRGEVSGDFFKFRDRNQHELYLGAAPEEAMAQIARGELRSYKQLPQIWYQVQRQFRDEPRPKSGLLRLREFAMADSCSFDLDEAGLEASYKRHAEAYTRVFRRCGLKFVYARTHSTLTGENLSSEFAAPCDVGEYLVAVCDCGYAANLQTAEAKAPPAHDMAGDGPPEAFPTPGVKTIDDLARFTGESPTRMIKTLVYIAEDKPVVLLLRGDHALSAAKLAMVLGTEAFRPATPEEALRLHGANLGSLGPVGLSGARVISDRSLDGRKNLVAGANQDETHLRNVTPGRDFTAEPRDIRVAAEDDLCLRCGNHLHVTKTIELSNLAKVGGSKAEALGATVLNQQGKEVPLVVGSYGIGLERILIAAIEQNHDEDGMILPGAIAPFDLILTAAQMDDGPVRTAAEKLYAELQVQGLDVLFDDRAERPGVKFKDADLIGVPYRITLGRRKLDQGLVEVFERSTKGFEDVKLENAVRFLKEKDLR